MMITAFAAAFAVQASSSRRLPAGFAINAAVGHVSEGPGHPPTLSGAPPLLQRGAFLKGQANPTRRSGRQHGQARVIIIARDRLQHADQPPGVIGSSIAINKLLPARQGRGWPAVGRQRRWRGRPASIAHRNNGGPSRTSPTAWPGARRRAAGPPAGAAAAIAAAFWPRRRRPTSMSHTWAAFKVGRRRRQRVFFQGEGLRLCRAGRWQRRQR